MYNNATMEIYWKSTKLRKELEDFDHLQSNYEEKVAMNIVQRLQELKFSASYVAIPPNAKAHSIKKGKKFLYFAVDLPHRGGGRGKWRLAFEPYGEYDSANQSTITAIKILGIENYHK